MDHRRRTVGTDLIMAKLQDLRGLKFFELTFIEPIETVKYGGQYKWKCVCSCGKEIVAKPGSVKYGHTKSCGHLVKGRVTHGLSRIPEYKSWTKIKERCYDPGCKDYANYGDIGIEMDFEYRESFPKFLDEVGRRPDTVNRWSIDRIDNNRGYTKGNMRWALDTIQARNKSKQKNNSSGFTGVSWEVRKNYTRAVVQWKEIVDGASKNRKKSFDANKYGVVVALYLANVFRKEILEKLRSEGYGYSYSHGQEKVVNL